ncbi:MAG: tRNA 4-thiouridine(8) synthase ThiI, partial [Nanoarchaeota archaeon]|nr:tRNA 4-thiouridine(8) synthase ThiI [Nanoarchaeota archaeon]
IFQEYELILFKHYIFKMAQIISKEYDYLAIVNGDSLSQVASQTLENINISSNNIAIQILRPLIGFEKEDIINIAKKIGTYDLSIENYKDCCSLISKNQTTKAKKDKFEKNLEKINFQNLCEKSFESLEVFKIK